MNKITKIILALTAMLAAGCADSTIAPKAGVERDVTIPGGGATAALTGIDTIRFTFVIDPSRSITYHLGAGNTIIFPAHSLCDSTRRTASASGTSRARLRRSPVTVYTKAWLDARGYAHVDFDKHVRFVPTTNPAGWVMLSLYDYGAMTTPWTKINYCPSSMAKQLHRRVDH